ncbi:hypothetical protein SORA22_12360 [Streptococcus oralis]|uniref:hypothetical protein n=1 Tax=Streptococcus oralis TaxID=1303 RepID=UPI00398C2225|nr:hypothetical protein OlisA3_0050 [Streptococcus phage OlisA3]
MFEPSLTSQLLGIGALLIGFLGAGIHVHNREERMLKEKEAQLLRDADIIRASQEAFSKGREAERRVIRENIRKPFPGFTFDNERPEGLKPELLALPHPKG